MLDCNLDRRQTVFRYFTHSSFSNCCRQPLRFSPRQQDEIRGITREQITGFDISDKGGRKTTSSKNSDDNNWRNLRRPGADLKSTNGGNLFQVTYYRPSRRKRRRSRDPSIRGCRLATTTSRQE